MGNRISRINLKSKLKKPGEVNDQKSRTQKDKKERNHITT